MVTWNIVWDARKRDLNMKFHPYFSLPANYLDARMFHDPRSCSFWQYLSVTCFSAEEAMRRKFMGSEFRPLPRGDKSLYPLPSPPYKYKVRQKTRIDERSLVPLFCALILLIPSPMSFVTLLLSRFRLFCRQGRWPHSHADGAAG